MSVLTLDQIRAEQTAGRLRDHELVQLHAEDGTGCCGRCGQPAPCDVRLDANNRLNNPLLRG